MKSNYILTQRLTPVLSGLVAWFRHKATRPISDYLDILLRHLADTTPEA